MSKAILAGVMISMALHFGFFSLNQRFTHVLEELRKIRKLLETQQEQKKTTIDLSKKP